MREARPPRSRYVPLERPAHSARGPRRRCIASHTAPSTRLPTTATGRTVPSEPPDPDSPSAPVTPMTSHAAIATFHHVNSHRTKEA